MVAQISSTPTTPIPEIIPVGPDAEYDYEALPGNYSLAANLTAGAFAGIMEHSVMYPLDAVKTRMQVLSKAEIYSGMTNAVSRISAAEGARVLWRGVSSVVIGSGPAHALYFTVYEHAKDAFLKLARGDDRGTGSGTYETNSSTFMLATAAAGSCATIACDAIMNPFDVVKQRMQVSAGANYSSIFSCAADVYRREGLSAFYISYPTTLTMSIPFQAINFSSYEALSNILNPSKHYDPLSHCIAGGVAGATAAALTNPVDVIKTVLQTKGVSSDASIREAKSFMDAARLIYLHDGASGFLRGLRPRIVANVPSTAICWSAYELAKFYLKT
ncbi:hypothetical protein CANCADRAFT_2632 [Tortispora caseinolytica NRRL Y-17796]|uniref:Mitochondrial thiamine pyrophosphate carrier 1 n=1 Tax=Tortispora caseinolytica NRRL Y-17796 TaxID=767744 RepID=A0A1E4TGM0_9ASCO|nr:hypothetical protein CANCADRAFT_2632 [Tortispora caseinolytica NRRL Y-17796]